jgi:hypothetical protein
MTSYELCVETTKNRLIKVHFDSQYGMGDTNVSKPMEQGFSQDKVKILPKIYEATIDF